MYASLWRRLPGPRPVKALFALALAAAVVFVCFQWVFPWVADRLPVNDAGMQMFVLYGGLRGTERLRPSLGMGRGCRGRQGGLTGSSLPCRAKLAEYATPPVNVPRETLTDRPAPDDG